MFVGRSGTRLIAEGNSFFAQGFNCYFLAFCSNAVRRAILDGAKQLGANTIRSWAFLDSVARTDGQVTFQYRNGQLIEQNAGADGLERLDHLISTAEELNLKLILPFVNYWPDFGGMPMYLHWLGLPREDPAEFYRSPGARNAFRAWIEHLLNRRNLFTGRFYWEEPAVLAWELANEPRCPGGRQLLLDWMAEMSEFAKELDSNHLLATGDEGFLVEKGRSHLYNGTYGVDFEAILGLPNIDLGTFHLYLQHWGESASSDFPQRWMRDHIEIGAKAEKPVLLEEFGLACDESPGFTDESRKKIYRDWTGQMRTEGGAGVLAWMLGHHSSEVAGFRDQYTIYAPDQTEPSAEADSGY